MNEKCKCDTTLSGVGKPLYFNLLCMSWFAHLRCKHNMEVESLFSKKGGD